jgi:hypothetical protein
MSSVRFEVADLAEIRFGISPVWEAVTSLWLLQDPARHAIHLPWVKQARPLTRRRDVAPHFAILAQFIEPKRWLPDFLTSAPSGPLVDLDAELEVVRSTPPERVTADLLDLERNRPLRPFARALADDPRGMLPVLVTAVRVWFDAAIAPHWPRMRALFEADIAYRARQLADGGAKLLFDTLHPAAHWAGDRVVIADRHDVHIDVRGRGFPMTPSLVGDRGPLLTVSDWALPTMAYPVRAAGTLWEPALGRASSGLSGVLGPARAGRLSLGAVSQHLGALTAAGLLTRNRQGRCVFYVCTDLGLALLRANAPG